MAKPSNFFGASWASQISGPQATRPLFPEIIRSYSNLYIAGNLEEVGLLWNIGMGQNLLYQGCEHHLPALGFTGMLLTAIYASCLWIGEQKICASKLSENNEIANQNGCIIMMQSLTPAAKKNMFSWVWRSSPANWLRLRMAEWHDFQ